MTEHYEIEYAIDSMYGLYWESVKDSTALPARFETGHDAVKYVNNFCPKGPDYRILKVKREVWE